MKAIIVNSIMLVTAITCFGQVSMNYTRNQDFYKPYTDQAKKYSEVNDKVYSNTQTANIKIVVYQNEKYAWNAGLTYKKINHRADSKVLGYYEHYVSPSQGLDYYIFRETDVYLSSESHSVGIINELDYTFLEKSKLINKIGLANEIYLFERYSSVYKLHENDLEFNDEIYDIYLTPLNFNFGNRFLFSAVNFSLYYKLEWKPADYLQFGTKISFGTNLYSDWDQFRRYAWIGLGLEVSFGKKGN